MRRRSRIHLQSVGYRIPFSPMIPARLLIAAPSTHRSDQEAADKQAWSLLPARAFVHAHSLASRTALFTYMCLSAQVNGGETRVHSGPWHAGRSLKNLRPACQRARAFPSHSLEQTNTCM